VIRYIVIYLLFARFLCHITDTTTKLEISTVTVTVHTAATSMAATSMAVLTSIMHIVMVRTVRRWSP
jgi:hypothetical protein